MTNEMQFKLAHGHALSVRDEGHEIADGLFVLKRFVPMVDYCDPMKGRWISSIGIKFGHKEIYAAVDSRFCNDINYDCLYSR